MPIITVKMARGRPVEIKKDLAAQITQTCAQILQVEPAWVTVLFEEFDRENWATGGELHSMKFGPGFGKTGTPEGSEIPKT